MNMAVNVIPGGTKLVIAVPHARNNIPIELGNRILYNHYNHQGHDLHAEEIFKKLSEHGPVILGIPNRELIDYNRSRNENSPINGVLPEEGFHRNKFLDRPHTFEEKELLLRKYWDEYHNVLNSLTISQYNKNGSALIITGHTMEGVGPQNSLDAGMQRPDICIGTLEYTLAKKLYLDTFLEALQKKASRLEVMIDIPCDGEGEISRQYGKPIKGLNVIQIEVNINSYGDLIKKPVIEESIIHAVSSLVKVFN